MYRVVIIDDEPVIVRGLSQLLPWEKYGCEVAGTAQDGQEGLALIRSIRPHIVFSDIYMPRMDGLAMAAALKSEFEDMELTVLTGYRDFELAQKAIRLGVRRFLLKPSNMEELEEAVAAMTAQLRRKGITGDANEGRAYAAFGRSFTGGEDSEPGRSRTGSGDDAAFGRSQTGRENAASGHSRTDGGDAGREGPGKGVQARDTESGGGSAENPAGSFIVNRALAYMRENYSHKLTLTDVAEHMYVSQWHLSKLLNRHTGQSFSELLNTIRVREAKKLLIDPALRVGDVAEQVGFLDMAHFSRVFKKITGVSAVEYRKQI